MIMSLIIGMVVLITLSTLKIESQEYINRGYGEVIEAKFKRRVLIYNCLIAITFFIMAVFMFTAN